MRDHFRIAALSGNDDRSAFQCGQASLDCYFRELVSQDIRRRITTCFVAVDETKGKIAGYYTLCATSIQLHELPVAFTKKLPRYPVVPAALIGRLAVDQNYQGSGLGGYLLGNALDRVLNSDIGIYAVLVDAIDGAAKRFYEHYGFIEFGQTEMRLMLPVATIKAAS